MNFKETVHSIFSGLSRLYPKEYQKEYSREMNSVFWDILDDSGSSTNWHSIRSLIRECVCLPGCLVREYVSISKGGPMKTTRQVFTATTLGFLSVFFLFAVERGIYRSFPDLPWTHQPQILLLELVVDGIISGLLAGGAIGFAVSIKNKLPMMVVCGLGFIAGRLVTGPGYWDMLGIPTGWVNSNLETFFIYAASPVTGLLVGVLAGLLWKGWKTGIVFGLAGGVIFTLGFLGDYASWYLLFDRGMVQIVPKFLHANLWIFLCSLIGYSVFGVIAGILWGILLDRLPRIRSFRRSTSD